MWDSLLTTTASKIGGQLLSKWNERKHVCALLDLHKRRIRETRITNNYYAELRGLRETFLQHGLAEKNAANREFFDKWLSDPVVEMGWTPAGGWNVERISALRTDVEKLQA
jgi:hypothetical protein